MQRILLVSPYIIALVLGLALGVAAMLRGIDRHLQRRGRVAVLNMPTIAAFATIAGAVGYPLARYSSLGPVAVTSIAAGSGLAAAIGAFGLLAGLIVPSAAKDVEDPRFVLQGHFGRVTERIPTGGLGEIVYEHDGRAHTVPARTLEGRPADEGTEVVIERIEDGVAHVELWSTIEKELELPA